MCRLLGARGLPYLGIDCQSAEPSAAVDIRQKDAVTALFHQHAFDVVIHLAAILPTAAREDPGLATAVNIDGSRNLLEAALQTGASRFVFGSSTAIYGIEGKNVPLNEEVEPTPTEIYGGSKRFVELYGENMARSGALKFVSLRIATVVGLGVRNTASPWRSEIFEPQAKEITIPCGAQAVLSMVHVEDVASMLVTLATTSELQHARYNTPAEDWRAAELKQFLESLPVPKRVVLDEGIGRPTPPVSDGSRFAAEFHTKMRPVSDRLREAQSGGAA